MNARRMEEQLILHEGLRLQPYQCTEGYWTCGVGYNLDSRGVEAIEDALGRRLQRPAKVDPERPWDWVRLTREEWLRVLRADLKRYEGAVQVHFPTYLELDEVRQRVVLDLAFNMGFGALAFKNCIAAIKRRDWSRAARELYNSKWARQVDDGEGGKFGRADRLANMILTGKDYTR